MIHRSSIELGRKIEREKIASQIKNANGHEFWGIIESLFAQVEIDKQDDQYKQYKNNVYMRYNDFED